MWGGCGLYFLSLGAGRGALAPSRATGPMLTRRRFAFWVGLGLFSLGEKLRAQSLDKLAAAAMDAVASKPSSGSAAAATAEHWRAAANTTWRWFERETMVAGQWTVTGITAPIHKETGARFDGAEGYLADELVPAEVRGGQQEIDPETLAKLREEFSHHHASDRRKERHGRPPSKWLRSLRADELRIWLDTIEVPEADVSGMTFWEHLTRDHGFDPDKIEGLDEADQAKLHAAAHAGY